MTRAILTHGIAEAQLWTPKLLTTALWFDASDSSTITQASGAVSQWNDKSGNARNLTASGTRQPTLVSADQNGRDVVQFDGTSHGMAVAYAPSALSSFSWAAALKPDTSAKYQSVMRWQSNNDNDYLLLPWTSNETITPARILLSWDGGTTSYNSTGYSSGACVQTFVRSFGSTNVSWLNGTQVDSRSANSTNSPSFSGSLGFGYIHSFPSEYFKGKVFEVLLLTSALSAADRQKLEGYLAWKWGLQSNLPSTHPYKNYRP